MSSGKNIPIFSENTEITFASNSNYYDASAPMSRGLRMLVFRISRAARQICGPSPADRLSFGSEYDACMKTTVDDALREMPVAEAQK